MNINEKITITLNEDDVKKIVAQYLNQEGYLVKPEDVTLHVGYDWVGYGPGEHQVTRFEKCTAVVKGE